MNDKKEITIKEWSSNGGDIMINVYALNHTHPDHPYNQVKSQGARPEDYGIFHPLREEFKNKSRDELIEEIVNLRAELISFHSADAAGLLHQYF